MAVSIEQLRRIQTEAAARREQAMQKLQSMAQGASAPSAPASPPSAPTAPTAPTAAQTLARLQAPIGSPGGFATQAEWTAARQQFLQAATAGVPEFVQAGGAVLTQQGGQARLLTPGPGGTVQEVTAPRGGLAQALGQGPAQAPPGGTQTTAALTAAGAAPMTAFAPLGQQTAPSGLGLFEQALARLQEMNPLPEGFGQTGEQLVAATRADVARRREEGLAEIRKRAEQRMESTKAFLADIGALRGGFTGKALEDIVAAELRETRALEAELALQEASVLHQLQRDMMNVQFQRFQAQGQLVSQALQVAGFISDEEARQMQRGLAAARQEVEDIFRVIDITEEITPAQAATLARHGIQVAPGRTAAGLRLDQANQPTELDPLTQLRRDAARRLAAGQATADDRALLGLPEAPAPEPTVTKEDVLEDIRFRRSIGKITTRQEALARLSEWFDTGALDIATAQAIAAEIDAMFGRKKPDEKGQPTAPQIRPPSPQEARAVAP